VRTVTPKRFEKKPRRTLSCPACNRSVTLRTDALKELNEQGAGLRCLACDAPLRLPRD
jgi:transcription elongation factor Elf1